MDPVRSYLHSTEDLVVAIAPLATSVSEQIAGWIRDQIQFGYVTPGESIREVRLATRFGVSRGPVRDALKMLDREGLVEVGRRSGAQVRTLSPAELSSIFRIRAELSGMIFRLAAERVGRNPRQLNAVREGAATLVALAADGEASVSDYILVRRRLSMIVNLLANAPYLSRLSLELELELALHWAAMMGKGRQNQSSQAWSRIADAILEGRGDDADREGSRIVLDALEQVLRLKVGGPEPD